MGIEQMEEGQKEKISEANCLDNLRWWIQDRELVSIKPRTSAGFSASTQFKRSTQ